MSPEDNPPGTSSSTISCYNDHALAYDRYQQAVVPQYQTALDITAATLCRYVDPRRRILDLGCGTGNASAAILVASAGSNIFLLDGSSSMVETAATKIASSRPDAVEGTGVADLAGESWDAGIRPGFDAIVSTLVLEHLPEDCYQRTVRKCYDLLRPGGWMIAVEGYAEEESDMLGWFNGLMDERRRSLDAALSDEIARIRMEKEHHYYFSKRRKEEWWRLAGFERVHVVWQYLCIALMAGRRQTEDVDQLNFSES